MEENLNDKSEPFYKGWNWKPIVTTLTIICSLLGIAFIVIVVLIDWDKGKKDEDDSNDDNFTWKIQGKKIKTEWGEKINVNDVWKEYPRPELERKDWINLNGLWDYNVIPKDSLKPKKRDGKILVPFPIESALSGVMKNITDKDEIVYERKFKIPDEWNKLDQIFLNFGAVDWKCKVFINREFVGEHSGGYTPFSFDIKNYVKYNESNTVTVIVFDPSEFGFQARGKQTTNQSLSHIWYTPSSGIWQTVWIEPVYTHHIQKLIINNNFDNKEINFKAQVESNIKLKISATLSYNNNEIQKISITTDENFVFTLSDKDFHPWSPEEPNLYDIKIQLYGINQEVVDEVKSYTAIRKVTKEEDKGFWRIKLNGKSYFNMGTLDQGFWPDGLYTPPSEEAMIYDIQKLKEMGFNTIRKHIKVENSRYYYYCDKLGMLVWQDMPSGDNGGEDDYEYDPHHIDGGRDRNRTKESMDNYYKEWEEIIEHLKFFQSIIMWIPFNEAWGQFNTIEVGEFTKKKDSSRLVNPASGGNFRLCQDILDNHHYPHPYWEVKNLSYINVFGEYGGLGYKVDKHVWQDDIWSYDVFNTTEEVIAQYQNYTNMLKEQVGQGMSAAIYTQTTDVEGEINGLICYDRKDKFSEEETNKIRKLNKELIDSINGV